MENNSIQQAGSKLQSKLDSLKQQGKTMSELEKQLHQSIKNAPELLSSLLMQREQIERRTIKSVIRRRTKLILKWYTIIIVAILILTTVTIYSYNLMNTRTAVLMASKQTMEMSSGKTYEIFRFSNMKRCKINETTTELCREK